VSTRFSSFNALGLIVIFVIGGTLIILDWSLESCIDLTQAKATRYDYGRLEWKANSTFQLHRLAHESVESGIWSRATKDVPITDPGNLLASLDITSRSHPRLLYVDPAGKMKSSTEEESSHAAGYAVHDEVDSVPEEVGSGQSGVASMYNEVESIHNDTTSLCNEIASVHDLTESGFNVEGALNTPETAQDGTMSMHGGAHESITQQLEMQQLVGRAFTY
jgi:hypothetical protein